ncbi:MAG: DUF5320 domain-containing protein [Candidatus Aminicenantes bacterium]|nr:DUF5320 domain-containing protein [Candidatus Aminicenantes bacterium]MBL7083319.1 DUF5320 domain-containing protein [Candidatus Aminicenantes bacterium]NQT79693.1 DUF5320 domain-containing protein [Candidatus Aminicenantes bacterium]
MRNRHRWMYNLTGLPGWMRFGFSPGWVGRSPTGLGPAAQYLMYGTWPTPQMDYAWQQGQLPFSPYSGFPQPGFPTPYDPWGAAELTPEDELNFLKAEAEQLEDELYGIDERIKELKGEKK